MDIDNEGWHFSADMKQKFSFLNSELPDNNNTIEIRNVELRIDEREKLSDNERESLDVLLKRNEAIFQSGGDLTIFAVYRMNTKNHVPISVPPYPLCAVKGEF